MNCRHEQRSRNPFAAYVADRKDQAVRTQRKKVVVIAAHAARRPAKAVHFKAGQLRDSPRKKLRLHLLRNCDFVFEPLFFLLFEN